MAYRGAKIWNGTGWDDVADPRVGNLQTRLTSVEAILAGRNQPNGLAPLDSAGKLPPEDLPGPIVARLRATANQTLGAVGAWGSVAFAAEDLDTGNAHSTTVNTSRFTAPLAGIYRVDGSALWNTGATAGYRNVRLTRNGTYIPGSQGCGVSNASNYYSLAAQATLVTLAAGDYIELQAMAALASAVLFANSTDGSTMTVQLLRT